MEPKIFYNDGKTPVTLNPLELKRSRLLERQLNALGYEVSITTLTAIMKKVSEQKYFKIAPADYLPVQVGEGAWSSNLEFYRSFGLSDDFSTGIVNTGGNNARLAVGDAGVDALNIKVFNWGKSIGWSIMDLEMAAKSGNWDLVSAKEKARKMNWDLGIQEVAFLGLPGNSSCVGLLNQLGITVNTTTITAPISGLSAANLSTFIGSLLNVYRINCNRTAWPTHFIVPESDFLGLATPSSDQFPIKSRLQLMQETFAVMTGHADFKILPCAYADGAYHANSSTGGLNIVDKQVYTLLNYDDESIRMSIPVDYTNTLANSIDNFSFQNVGYGQFTGVLPIRPLEMMYFQFATP